MDYTAHEPHSPGATARPCSTPHSAPIGWLNGGASQCGGASSTPCPRQGARSGSARDIEPATSQSEAQPDNPPPIPVSTYATRHDGWTGEKMAIFCEALAETAVVAEACDAARMGISGAYAARRRNPVFAAAWDAALSIARERLADTLLARSMEGNIEQLYKDGELVGERHVLDNRLGLAILRRLDRLAEGGVCVSARDLPFSGQCRSPAVRPDAFNWEHAMDALRTGDDEGVAHALALAKGDKVEEVEAPRGGPAGADGGPEEDEGLDYSHRCWPDPIDDDIWMTDFPPPAGFAGYESRFYEDTEDEDRYERACTPEEVALLEGDTARAKAAERADDEARRDAWFEILRSEQEELDADRHPGLEPGSAFTSAAEEQGQNPRPDHAMSDSHDE